MHNNNVSAEYKTENYGCTLLKHAFETDGLTKLRSSLSIGSLRMARLSTFRVSRVADAFAGALAAQEAMSTLRAAALLRVW
jgi:hypothetical protein